MADRFHADPLSLAEVDSPSATPTRSLHSAVLHKGIFVDFAQALGGHAVDMNQIATSQADMARRINVQGLMSALLDPGCNKWTRVLVTQEMFGHDERRLKAGEFSSGLDFGS